MRYSMNIVIWWDFTSIVCGLWVEGSCGCKVWVKRGLASEGSLWVERACGWHVLAGRVSSWWMTWVPRVVCGNIAKASHTCILRWFRHLCSVPETIKCSLPITSASSTYALYHNKRAGRIVTHATFLSPNDRYTTNVRNYCTFQSVLWQLLLTITWLSYQVSIIRSTRVLKVIKRFL